MWETAPALHKWEIHLNYRIILDLVFIYSRFWRKRQLFSFPTEFFFHCSFIASANATKLYNHKRHTRTCVNVYIKKGENKKRKSRENDRRQRKII